jgi:hypothetical protein
LTFNKKQNLLLKKRASIAKVFMVLTKLSFCHPHQEGKKRGCRLVWSRLVDLGSIDPGSNPGSPISNFIMTANLKTELNLNEIEEYLWFTAVNVVLKTRMMQKCAPNAEHLFTV